MYGNIVLIEATSSHSYLDLSATSTLDNVDDWQVTTINPGPNLSQ